jgi:hypothetical protein
MIPFGNIFLMARGGPPFFLDFPPRFVYDPAQIGGLGLNPFSNKDAMDHTSEFIGRLAELQSEARTLLGNWVFPEIPLAHLKL